MAMLRGGANRRGITVLTLLLLIIAIIIAVVLLVRYLGGRPAVTLRDIPSSLIASDA